MDDCDHPEHVSGNEPSDHPSPPSREVQCILPALESAPQENKEPREKRIREWVQVLVNVVLVIVGIVAICIYYGELQVMKGQLGEIVRQYPEIQKQAKAATDAVNQSAADSAENSRRVERQLSISQKQATAATGAADIAKEALHVSERAYLAPAFARIDYAHRRIVVPIANSGHVPSGPVSIEAHEEMTARTGASGALSFIERHWKKSSLKSSPNGTHYGFTVEVPFLDEESSRARMQQTTIAGTITYNDGFPGTPLQSVVFCFFTAAEAQPPTTEFGICDEPERVLAEIKAREHYPDNEQRPNPN